MASPLDPDQDLTVGQFGFHIPAEGNPLVDIRDAMSMRIGDIAEQPMGKLVLPDATEQLTPEETKALADQGISAGMDALVPSAKLVGGALTFGSKLFKSFDQGKLDKAMKRLADGDDPHLVRMEEGYFVGPDGVPRIEFSDRNTKFLGLPKSSLGRNLDEVMGHDVLYKEYPDLKNVKVKVEHTPGTNGTFTAKFNKEGKITDGDITINPLNKDGTKRTEQEITETMLHETQHWIQVKEMMAEGSSPELFAAMREQIPELADSFKSADDTFQFGRFLNSNPQMRQESFPKIIQEYAANNPDAALNISSARKFFDGKTDLKGLLQAKNITKDRLIMAGSLELADDGFNYSRTMGEVEAFDVAERFRHAREITDKELRERVPALAKKTIRIKNKVLGTDELINKQTARGDKGATIEDLSFGVK